MKIKIEIGDLILIDDDPTGTIVVYIKAKLNQYENIKYFITVPQRDSDFWSGVMYHDEILYHIQQKRMRIIKRK